MEFHLVRQLEAEFAATGTVAEIKHRTVTPDNPSEGPIEHLHITCPGDNARVEADFFLFPEWENTDPRTPKYLVFSFLRASLFDSHFWREMSCNYRVFKWQGGGGTPSNYLPILELPFSRTIN
jgi:hypothetical protein